MLLLLLVVLRILVPTIALPIVKVYRQVVRLLVLLIKVVLCPWCKLDELLQDRHLCGLLRDDSHRDLVVWVARHRLLRQDLDYLGICDPLVVLRVNSLQQRHDLCVNVLVKGEETSFYLFMHRLQQLLEL